MSKVHIAAIAEYDHCSGEMFNVICTGRTPEEVTSKVNSFFEEEAASGHDVSEAPFESFGDLNANVTDSYGDHEYYISTDSAEV